MNVLGALNLADICHERGIHLTVYATGCIFHYDKDFPEGSGKGFKEDDEPNFTGSYYSKTKVAVDAFCKSFIIACISDVQLSVNHDLLQAFVEGLLKEYSNILILRIRMPIVADLSYPRNFVTKILKYEKVGFGYLLLDVNYRA